MPRFASQVNTMGRAALATSKPTPASAIIPIFRELEFILITKAARLRAAAQWVDRPSWLMERVYRSRALTMPVMRLAAVSLMAVRPNKARIATPGRVAIPPPTMKPSGSRNCRRTERPATNRVFNLHYIKIEPKPSKVRAGGGLPRTCSEAGGGDNFEDSEPLRFVHPERISVRRQTIIDRIGTGQGHAPQR